MREWLVIIVAILSIALFISDVGLDKGKEENIYSMVEAKGLMSRFARLPARGFPLHDAVLVAGYGG